MNPTPTDPTTTETFASTTPQIVAPVARTSSEAATVSDACDRINALYNRSRYLDAYKLGQQEFGTDLSSWSDVHSKVIAARLARKMGGYQLHNVLMYRLGRSFPEHPAAMPAVTYFAFGRRPVARLWLEIRHREIQTDDPILQSRWIGLKGRVLAGLRDFDRAMEMLHTAIRLTPDDPFAHTNLASSLAYRDDVHGAISACRDALAVAPGYGNAIQSLSHYLAQVNQVDESVAVLSEAVQENQCGNMRLQLSAIYERRDEFDAAAEQLSEIERYFPLADPPRNGRPKRGSLRASVAAYRSDLAMEAGDIETAVQQAKLANTKFYDRIADYLADNHQSGKRVRLSVPFVRQDNMTCAPATLAMLSKYWDVEVDHAAIVDDICYDGTPAIKQRLWAESNGMVARQFCVTRESAQQLLDAGIPFGLTTVEPGSAHIQVICGYDSRRDTWWVQDPGTWYRTEWGIERALDNYGPTGPRGLVIVPADRADLLDGIDLPEVDQYDQLHELSVALENHDREAAEVVVARMRAWDADHRTTLWADITLARYDNNSPGHLDAIQKLVKKFPDDQGLMLSETRLLAHLDRSTQVIDRLRAAAKEERVATELQLRLYYLLRDANEIDEAAQILTSLLRSAPTHSAVLSAEALELWHTKKKDESLELRRLAATTSDLDERMARNYLEAAIDLGRQDEVLDGFRQRFESLGSNNYEPALTYAFGLDLAGQPKQAVEVLHEALRQRPDDGELLCTAARMLGRLDCHQSALQLLDTTTIVLPKLSECQTRAVLYEYDGRLDEALNAFQELGKTQTTDPYVIEETARLTNALFGIDTTIDYLSQLTQSHPHCRHVLCTSVEWLRNAARYDEAIDHLDRLLSAHPGDGWAWRERALINKRCGRFDQAVKDAEEGLRNERSVFSWSILADALVDVGRIDEAKEHFRSAINESVDYVYAISDMLAICDSVSERKEALEFVFQNLCEQRTDGRGLTAYYQQADGVIDPEQLLANMQVAKEARPDLIEPHLLVSECLRDLERYDEAELGLLSVAAPFDHRPVYWRELGDVNLDRGDNQRAADLYQIGFDLNPNWADIARRLATAHVNCDQTDKAVAVLHRALKGCPNDVSLLMALAQTTGDQAEAFSLLRRAGILEPSWDTPWRELRERSEAAGQRSIGIEAAHELVRQRPNDSYSHLRLAQMLNATDECDTSIAAIRRALELNPANVACHRVLVARLAEKGLLEAALAACQPQAVDPREAVNLEYTAANILYELDRKTEACQRMKDFLAKEPGRFGAWTVLADWAEELGDDELYDFAADSMMSGAPRWHVSFGYHHTTLLRQGKRDEAIAALRHAAILDPTYSYAVDTYLGMQLESKQIDAADQLLQEIGSAFSSTKLFAYELWIAMGANDGGRFIAALVSETAEEVDPRSAIRFACRNFDMSNNQPIAVALNQAMERSDACEAIGYAWANTIGKSDNLDWAIHDFRSFVVSDAWHVAARELLTTIDDLEEKGPQHQDTRRPLFDRVFKLIEPAMFQDPITWSSVIWTQLSLRMYRPAIKLAKKHRLANPTFGNNYLAAMIASLYKWNPKLLAELGREAIRCDHETTIGEVHVMLAIHHLFQGDDAAMSACLAKVDVDELPDWYAGLVALLSMGQTAISSGNAAILTGHWIDNFDEKKAYYNRRIYHQLRYRVAKANGRWCRALGLWLTQPSQW
ncbi:MAG: tetratricopeptide repeat protein [Pirellulaceae bacterium]|nr:tetratricopeptide repeat protein [Pirellulaceae bacterium]